jgi:hypothetical protein
MALLAMPACLALAACGDVAFDGSAEDRVAFIAGTTNAVAPIPLGNGARLSSASAEGDVLVLRMDGVVQGPVQDVSEAEMLKALRPIVCDNDGYRGVIEDGARIRFELSSSTGDALPPITLAYCPPTDS